jgi:hypothetical protein
MDDAMTAIAYLWQDSENYWPATVWDGDPADPFSPGGGLHYFEAARARLAAAGLRVPTLYLSDHDRAYYPADLAIVEDFPHDLETLLARDRLAAEPAMDLLGDALDTMRGYGAPAMGRVAHIDGGGRSRATSGKAAALQFGLRCLTEAAKRDTRIAAVRDQLKDKLHALAAAARRAFDSVR